jgi:membrane protein required for colicin V production
MPSYLDLGVIAVVLISGLLAMLRGFTREVLAIGSWVAAAAAAYYLHPLALPYIKPHIAKDTVAMAVAAALVFFVTLVLVSIITVKISDLILDSKVGALDRSLGFVFGAARGFLLCVVAFIFFDWFVPKNQPAWVADARTKPILQATGEKLKEMLPDDPEGILAGFKKKGAAPGAEAPAEDDDSRTAPPSPPPRPIAPARPSEAPAQGMSGMGGGSAVPPAERQRLNQMLQGAPAR